jgi:hypothetical protein
VISLDFRTGTREKLRLELVDRSVEPARALTDPENGNALVVLELLWPDHPTIARARYEWLALVEQVAREIRLDDGSVRPDVPAARVAELLADRDAALERYAVAIVAGWNVAGVECTPAAVRALFASSDFVLGLVIDAIGNADRFLPSSLRPSANASALESEAVS